MMQRDSITVKIKLWNILVLLSVMLLSIGYSENSFSQSRQADFDWTFNGADYGARIAGISDMWWCGSAYKVGKNRKLPSSKGMYKEVRLDLAKNEYEAVQIVIKPEKKIFNVTVKSSDLTGANGKLLAENITISQVRYVRTTEPTDTSTIAGFWPDPIIALDKPADLDAHVNNPFWITVYAPKGVSDGIYKGELLFSGDNWSRKVPFEVNIWNFTLSDERHLKTAFGLNLGAIAQYHNVKGKDLEAVIDLYYENFSRHRISPYDPTYGAQIHVDWGIDKVQKPDEITSEQVKVDFSDFDRGMERSIRKYHFNSVRIPLLGVGRNGYAGTMYYPGLIGPYTQGTKEYNLLLGGYLKQLQDHLEKKGWLDIAYIYWYDEPSFLVYKEIREMGETIKRYAPKLKWMLTDKISLDLVGPVDIWNPVLHNFQPDTSRIAQSAGYKMWWYICTVPKAPYVGEFIDHAAIEPRLWLWQTWKNNVQGILIWSVNYWTNSVVYNGKLQNPWTDPESWWSGRVGDRWGNGDGRFLYPPNFTPNTTKTPIVSGPVNSIRWELLRDGIEDYEYFWTLRDLVRQFSVVDANSGLNNDEKNWEIKARELLVVPDNISTGLTNFSKNPLFLMQHRVKLAKAIQEGKQLLNGRNY